MFCMAKVLPLAPTQDIYSDSSFLDSGCGDQMLFDNLRASSSPPTEAAPLPGDGFLPGSVQPKTRSTLVSRRCSLTKPVARLGGSSVGAVLVGVGWLGETETNGDFLITAPPNLLLFLKFFSEVS